MTNKEKISLNALADRIDELASLENCSSLVFENKDRLRLYMKWFSICANDIRRVVELSDEKNRCIKDEGLSQIIRLNL